MRAADEILSAACSFKHPTLCNGYWQMFKRFLTDESGATAIEYGLIAGLIFLAIVTAVHYYIENTEAMYKRIGDAVVGATTHDG